MTHNPEHAAAQMALQSILLSTLSSALSFDLAVTPVILATDPGIGTNHMTRGIVEGMDMVYVDVRCEALSERDFAPMHAVVDGEVVETEGSLAFITEALSSGRNAFVMLDEALTTGRDVVVGLLRKVADDARGNVIVALRVAHSDEEEALLAIAEGLGIHRVHVPTARLAYGRTVAQPVLLTGLANLEGSKCGLRYLTMLTEMPFEAEVRFHVDAKPDQDDDALNEAIYPIFERGTTSAARLENVDGTLVCTTDDLLAC